MSDYPIELLPSEIFTIKRAPVLWIGSGFSRRFVKGFRTWEDLLMDAASMVGVDRDRFIAIKMSVQNNIKDLYPSEEDINSGIASKLSALLIEKFSNGSLKPSDFFEDGDLEQYRHGVDPLKLIICSGMKSVEFKEEFSEEIKSFKRLIYSIPAVVTTNYDNVIEMLFDDKFKTYNSIDEYYGSSEVGIGEIHKIHGTIKMPRSIVLTSKDYEIFHKKSAVISSRIITLMCDSPLLILGYSMNDKIVRDIIGKMFTSFSREKANEISRNILYINHCEGSEPALGIMQIQCSTGTFNIKTLTADSFLPIFEDLGRQSPKLSIPEVRRIKKMLIDVDIDPSSCSNTSKRLFYVGIDDIENVDPERTIVALTTKAVFDIFSSYRTHNIDDIIKDVLEDMRFHAESIIDIWFEHNKQGLRTFIPIFGYLQTLNRKCDEHSKKMRDYIKVKNEQYITFFEENVKSFKDVVDVKSMESMMKNYDLKFKRSDLIMYAYYLDIIDKTEVKTLLKEQYDNAISSYGKTDTNIKRAVTYITFKELTV